MSEISAKEVRKQFPNPQVMPVWANGYCVGWALCMYMKRPLSVFEGLMAANPNLTMGKAKDFHRRIVDTNDAGDFDEAWNLLDEALTP